MTREEAIQIIRETYHTDEEMKALESLIPELRESEDEKVRALLVSLVQWAEIFPQSGLDSDTTNKMLSYLEKQKEQKSAGWSEEDEKKIHFLSRLIEFQVKDGEYCFGKGSCAISKQEAIEMLKSLRPQPHWKPSEEQMEALARATNRCVSVKDANTLLGLLNQIKNL